MTIIPREFNQSNSFFLSVFVCILVFLSWIVASLIKNQPLEKIKEILSKGTKNEIKTNVAVNVAATSASNEKKE